MSTPTELFQVQAHLIELYGPDHYYTKEYAKHETGYFGKIPEWMRWYGLGRVLDVGPGYGTLACYAHKQGATQVCTVDRTPYISPEVAEEFKLLCITRDIERETFLDYSIYNTVIITEVLEHFNFHPLPTLEKLAGHMAHKGVMFLSTPDSEGGWGKLAGQPELGKMKNFDQDTMGYYDPPWIDAHVRHYSEDEVRCMLQFAGLTVVGMQRSGSAMGVHLNIAAVKL